MRVILAGGGTGGHIYPAIAIADKIKRKQPDSEILFIGTSQGMESEIIPAAGYDIRFINVRGFSRKSLVKNVGIVMELLAAGKQARGILRDFAPDVVIGTGGYVSGPVMREGGKLGIPTFLHEQNALPGLANKMAEKYVTTAFLAFPEAKAHFRRQDKLLVTGNPIRKAFITAGIADYRGKLGVGPSQFVVLCFGGSRGAQRINDAMSEILGDLDKEGDIKVYFITGKPYFAQIQAEAEKRDVFAGGRVEVLPYTDVIHEYLSAADLVISRSGALTVSEITACGKPSILIPSPNVTGNHQYFNAKTAADAGAAIILEEQALSGEKLLHTILRLKHNKEVLNSMAAASGALARTDAVDVIYDEIHRRSR